MSINGDILVDDNGNICLLSDKEEIKQRLYIMLSARLGGFIYDRELGSELPDASLTDSDQVAALARKALCRMPEAEVTGVEISDDSLFISVEYEGNVYDINVRREMDR